VGWYSLFAIGQYDVIGKRSSALIGPLTKRDKAGLFRCHVDELHGVTSATRRWKLHTI
jgi:hypothetical protein